jgi:ComF family protein
MDLLMPPACAACGRFGSALCGACLSSFQAPGRADDRFMAPDAAAVSGDRLILALAAFAYDGASRRALGRLKYAGAARVARPLAEAAVPTLRRLAKITGPATLVPVPLHVHRQRERGYNQAALLAEHLGRAAGTAVRACLVRRRETSRQHGLDRAARLRNLASAFEPATAGPPSVVILVDDILTTSATMEACAAVLCAAGSKAVYGLAIAREV